MSLGNLVFSVLDTSIEEKFALRRDAVLRRAEEILIDSEKVLKRAVTHGVKIRAVLATPAHYERHAYWLKNLPECHFYQASEQQMMAITGFHVHQGMVGLGERPSPISFGDGLGERVLMLNKIMDAQNVGVILRSAHGFGFKKVFFDQNSCSPYVRRAIRVSMGSVFCLQIGVISSWHLALQELKNKEFQVLALALNEKAKDIRSIDNATKLALILGNEDQGIEPDILAASDHLVHIPMHPGIDSLNVAMAASIACFQLQI